MPRQRRRRGKVTQETDYDSPVEGRDEDEIAAADDTTTAAEAAMAVDRVNVPDEPASVTEPDDEVTRRAKVATDAPYHAEGFNVYDGRGNRVVICGTDDNRAASGPAIALSVAYALNRVAEGH